MRSRSSEAAERYSEFAARMSGLGNDDVATVFGALARMESEHLETLARKTRGIELPAIDASE